MVDNLPLISYSIEECGKTQCHRLSRRLGKCWSMRPTSRSSGGVQTGCPLESLTSPYSLPNSSPITSNTPTSPPSSGKYLFLTQLNMYNFHKRKTPEGVQFYHQLFRKGQRYALFNVRQLLIGIRRKPSEAEILQGEELIRKLAPQCLKGISSNTQKTGTLSLS